MSLKNIQARYTIDRMEKKNGTESFMGNRCNNNGYTIDLQSGLDTRLEQAREYVQNRFDADKLVHLSRQPNYLTYPDGEIDGLEQFLFYKACPQQIDNDVSAGAWAVYLAMHPFLDEKTLRRQTYHDARTWTTVVFDQKLTCDSSSSKVLGNRRTSRDGYIGDACTSMWTPLRNHLNHAIQEGLEAENGDTARLVEILGRDEVKSWDAFKKLYLDKNVSEELGNLVRTHISPACMLALELSDTIGNMMVCPQGCNATRSNWGKNDTAEYFLVHVYKYFEMGDVRFLNRLFAGAEKGNRGRYVEYRTLDDVPAVANYAAKGFMVMMERAGVDGWEDFVDKFCFCSFCVEWDAEIRPMDLRRGRPFEWDGEAHYEVATKNLDEDARMFSNLNDCVIKRNVEIAAKIG